MGLAIAAREGVILGVDVGRPIVTNEDFVWRSCAKVPEAMGLSFGVLSGVGPGIGVLDGIQFPKGTGEVFWGSLVHWFE